MSNLLRSLRRWRRKACVRGFSDWEQWHRWSGDMRSQAAVKDHLYLGRILVPELYSQVRAKVWMSVGTDEDRQRTWDFRWSSSCLRSEHTCGLYTGGRGERNLGGRWRARWAQSSGAVASKMASMVLWKRFWRKVIFAREPCVPGFLPDIHREFRIFCWYLRKMPPTGCKLWQTFAYRRFAFPPRKQEYMRK